MKPKILLAESKESSADVVRAVAGALGALEVDLRTVDLGRVGETGSRLGRVVQAILGEAEAGRLVRELTTSPPDVAIAFDAPALHALTVARDRRAAPTAIVAVVADIAPGKGWAVNADRFAAADDEAAVALSDQGVDGARVVVTGPIVPRALHEAARAPRAREELKISSEFPVVLVDAATLSVESLSQLLLQLSLLDRRCTFLFDAGASAAAAALLRKQVPALGLKGKLFGQTVNAPRLWRCADVIVARPTARMIHAALALGIPLCALEAASDHERGEAQGLVDRRQGTVAGKILLLASALDPLLAGKRQPRPAILDGAAEIADLVAQVAKQRDEVLAETLAQLPKPPPPVSAAAAADLEDLGDGDGLGAAPPPEVDELREKVIAAERRARKELDDARAEAEKWEQRKIMAEAQGDKALAEQATREAGRKRARMHVALEELARISAQRGRVDAARGAGAGSEDVLAAFKKKVAAGGAPQRPRTVDDELADLKRRMDADKKRR